MRSSDELTADQARALLSLGLGERDEPQLTPGTIVADRFRIIALAGRGGMGDVYRADDMKLGQVVALKFLPASASDFAAGSFYDEVRVGRQVAHPNVARIYDLVDVDGRPAIVMEFVEGEDLSSLLRRTGMLPHTTALAIARDVVAGVDAAHEKGIVHGDLKPSNVMIDGRGRARITDFGLARIVGESAAGGRIAGTLAYIPPEQLQTGVVSIRGDLYSLGIMLYEIFTGVRPGEMPQPPSAVQPLLAPSIDAVIVRCLQRDPSQRPTSTREIRDALPSADILDLLLAANDTPTADAVAQSNKVRELSRSATNTAAIAALVLLAVVVVLSQRLTLYGRSALPFSSRALAELGRAIASETVHAPFSDEAYWFEADLEQHYGSPIVFHYRASVMPLVPTSLDHQIHDEQPIAAGAVHAVLRPDGKLAALRAIGEEGSDAYVATPNASARPQPEWPRAAYLVYFVLLVASLAAGASIARRNIRRRVVDIGAARRIAVWVLFCRTAYGVIGAHHPLTFDGELSLIASIIGTALLLVAQVWLGYVALEPYVRRAAPQLLIGWTRAIHGLVRNRIVGRDVLLGTLAGLLLRLVDHIRNAMPWGVIPSHLAVRAMTSIRDTAANVFLFQARAVFYALFALFLIALLEILLRGKRVAAVVWLAATTLAWIRWDEPFVVAPAIVVQMAIVLLVIKRLGLLAATAAIFVHLLTVYTPLTANFSAFYFPQSALATALIAAMAIGSWWVCNESRPILQ